MAPFADRTSGPLRWIAPLVIALAALAVRAGFQHGAEAYPRLELIRNALDDQVLFESWARSLVLGTAVDWPATRHEFAYWAARWPGVFPQDPGYAYALAAFFRLFGFAYDGVRALQAALGVGTALLVWALARRHVSPAVAAGCGLAAALYRPLVFYEATLLREPLATLLLASTLVLLTEAATAAARRRALLLATAAGALAGMAVLVRSHLALVAAALGLWFFLGTRRQWGARPALGFLAALAAAVAPAVATNVARSGRLAFVSSAAPYNLLVGNLPDGAGTGSPRYRALRAQGPPQEVDLLAALRGEAADHPWAAARQLARKAAWLFGAREVPDNLSVAMGAMTAPALRLAVVTDALLMPLALLGMAVAVPAWRRHGLLYGCVAGYAASVIPFVVVSRLRQPLLPALAVFAGVAVEAARERAFSGRRRAALALALAAGILAALLHPRGRQVRDVDYLMAAAAYERLGELREQAGDAAGAFRAYGRAVALNPDHGEAVGGAARVGAVLARTPDSEAAGLCAQARDAADAGRYEDALRLLDRAAGRAPGWALPFKYRANVDLLRRRTVDAVRDLEQAVALDPGDAQQRLNLKALRGAFPR